MKIQLPAVCIILAIAFFTNSCKKDDDENNIKESVNGTHMQTRAVSLELTDPGTGPVPSKYD